MPLRNVATTFTIEQQRLEINNLAGDVNNIASGATATTASSLAAGATGADLTLSGTLTVNGTQTILNTETLQVEDKEIVIGNVSSPTDATANGGGWKLKGADNKTITYNQTGDKWVSNKDFEVPQLIATQGATTEFIQAVSTNNGTRAVGSFEGKDSSGNAVTLKMGGYGDTNRGEIFTHSNHALGFATNNAAAQMILDTNGYLGIGIDPTSELEVNAASNECTISLYNDGTKKAALQAQNSFGTILYSYGDEPLKFSVTSGTSYAERLQITTDKVMTSVDFKPDAHHTRDIGTASNAFRDIYGQTITVSTAYDSKGNLRSIPVTWHNGSAYTLIASDAGKFISEAYSGGNITVPANTFSTGDAITIMNHTGGIQTITQDTGVTMYNAADGSTGNRTLAQRGLCTIFFREHNVVYISGAGLS